MKKKHYPKKRARTHEHLDREHAEIKRQLSEVNRELKKKTYNTIVWAIIFIVVLSSIVTTIEVLRFLHPAQIEDIVMVEHKQEFNILKGENWDYVLNNITTDKKRYAKGETATATAEIKSKKEGEANIEFILTDQTGKKIYRYNKKREMHNKQTIKKNILLTKNYEPGKYYLTINILVDENKQLLTGTTMFEIEDNKILARLNNGYPSLTKIQILLVVIIILLNITLICTILHKKSKV